MDSTLRRVPRQNVVRAKNRAISRRERLHWKRELNQELSADLGKHYATCIPDLVQTMYVETIDNYLEEEGKKISPEKFDVYDGKWPFDIPEAEPVHVSKRKKKGGYTRRQARYAHDAVFSEKQRQGAFASVDRRKRRAA